MKKIIVMSVLAVLATGAALAAAVRVETRSAPLIATGVERVGSADGSTVTEWDTTVVPSCATLTLGAGCIVKFTDGARIVVESGGAVVAEGAYLAAFDDDGVGGDTDMNGRRVEGNAPYQSVATSASLPCGRASAWPRCCSCAETCGPTACRVVELVSSHFLSCKIKSILARLVPDLV